MSSSPDSTDQGAPTGTGQTLGEKCAENMARNFLVRFGDRTCVAKIIDQIIDLESAKDRVQASADHELLACREVLKVKDGDNLYDAIKRLLAQVQPLIEALEVAAKALEHCRQRPHEHNPVNWIGPTRCNVIDRALATIRDLSPQASGAQLGRDLE
jgi:hypothetical protein